MESQPQNPEIQSISGIILKTFTHDNYVHLYLNAKGKSDEFYHVTLSKAGNYHYVTLSKMMSTTV